jgi:hypothetical protein
MKDDFLNNIQNTQDTVSAGGTVSFEGTVQHVSREIWSTQQLTAACGVRVMLLNTDVKSALCLPMRLQGWRNEPSPSTDTDQRNSNRR